MAIFDVGLVMTHEDGGHPVLVLSDRPAASTDIVVIVNLTGSNSNESKDVLFPDGYKLSGGYTCSKDSTIYLNPPLVKLATGDSLVKMCTNCGYASLADVTTARAYLGANVKQITDPDVKAYVIGQGW